MQRADGRFETARPGSRADGSREESAVRPENLRLFLEEYDGLAPGDEVAFAGGEFRYSSRFRSLERVLGM